MRVPLRSTLCVAVLLLTGACRSAEDVWRDLGPAATERLAHIQAAARALPPEHPTPQHPTPQHPTPQHPVPPLEWPAVPVRICSTSHCPPGPHPTAWLTTEAALAGVTEAPLGSAQAPEWSTLPQGTPQELRKLSAAALQEQLQRLTELDHLLIVRSTLRVDPWIPLNFASLDVLAPPDVEGSTGEHAERVFIDARLWGELWWYDLGEARWRGGLPFAVDHEVAERDYTLAERHELLALMRNEAWSTLRSLLREGIPEELLPRSF